MTPERAEEIAQVLADSLATGEASSIGVSWAEAIAEGIKLACAEQRQEYADLMDEAAVNVSDWGAYASEYFQDKWDLAGYVKKWQDRAAAIRAGK
jgi:hypothetical protein